jgi:hypothetical protein
MWVVIHGNNTRYFPIYYLYLKLAKMLYFPFYLAYFLLQHNQRTREQNMVFLRAGDRSGRVGIGRWPK